MNHIISSWSVIPGFLQGTGVQYKLINAGLSIESNDVASSQQAFTLYSRYWFETAI